MRDRRRRLSTLARVWAEGELADGLCGARVDARDGVEPDRREADAVLVVVVVGEQSRRRRRQARVRVLVCGTCVHLHFCTVAVTVLLVERLRELHRLVAPPPSGDPRESRFAPLRSVYPRPYCETALKQAAHTTDPQDPTHEKCAPARSSRSSFARPIHCNQMAISSRSAWGGPLPVLFALVCTPPPFTAHAPRARTLILARDAQASSVSSRRPSASHCRSQSCRD